jgi:hypothetical protein
MGVGILLGPGTIFAARRWPGAAMNIDAEDPVVSVTLPQR